MRRERDGSAWQAAIIAALIVFGGYFLWRGALAFLSTAGDITAPATATAAATVTLRPTRTFEVPPMNLIFGVRPTARPCLEFYVTVMRARVRECPSERCETLAMPYRGNRICVYGRAEDAPEWYEVNLRPDDPIPHRAYMHQSVIAAVNPTPRPSATVSYTHL
ncbi:MAG: hypothetical protein J7551_12515, partial [Chloroflexi bacterium]|nr:hypothetical protein [Chloroflexota bacterium]